MRRNRKDADSVIAEVEDARERFVGLKNSPNSNPLGEKKST
jgi:hypothetical protein